MFSVSDPSNIMSLLSRLWIHEPTLVWRARKNSTINFQECLGASVRQCIRVSPSGMASQSFRLRASLVWCRGGFSFWEKYVSGQVHLLMFFWNLARWVPLVCPYFFTALTTSSIESVASVFRKMQFDKSVWAHAWELGVILRSACIIPFGIGLFR